MVSKKGAPKSGKGKAAKTKAEPPKKKSDTPKKKATPSKKASVPKEDLDRYPADILETLERIEGQNDRLKAELAAAAKNSKELQKRLSKLEKKMDTRGKREDIIMSALELNNRSRKGDRGAVGRLTQSLLATDEHVLSAGKRMESMLSALKNHREFLIRLNKKVYKVEPLKRMEMELEIMGNTLSIMALRGFDIDKGLFGEMKRIIKILEKEDADLPKVQKRMASFRKKFEDEMERFDFETIFRKSDDIPGYR